MSRGTCGSLTAALALAAALVAAGCGESSDTASESETVTQTVERTVTEPEAAPTTAQAESAPPAEPPASSSSSRRIRVPDVVGQDHQLAQDTMQAAGLYNLDEEDATGQGRLLLYDRNWTVVEQDPPAGSRVDADTRITLRSKKDGE